MDSPTRLVLLANLASTLFMVGVIWFVQIVHYPLFAAVGESSFAAYADSHSRLTGFVVVLPMLVELASAALLLFLRPPGIPISVLWFGVFLVALIWVSTAVLQVPRHATLALGFDGEAHALLVFSNWLRTLAWSLRGGLCLWMVAKTLR